MNKLTIILIVLSAVVAVIATYFQYFYKEKEKSQYVYWLSFLRSIAIFLVLVLLVNPSVKKVSYTTVKPTLNVVFDNSKSIEFLQNGGQLKAYYQSLLNDEDLAEKFHINYFKFGTKLQSLDSLNFQDNYTNISGVFNTFSSISNDNNQAVVLFTDGIETMGAKKNSMNNAQVYSLIVGDTLVHEDVYIDRLNVNPTTFLDNNAPVEIFVNYIGGNSINKAVSLFENDIRIASKQVSLNHTQNATSISFFITANKQGRHYYSARIEPLAEEINTENNRKSFALNVIQEQSKIVILSDIVHPDIGMLKNSIEQNKARDVSLKSIDEDFSVNEFDLVILYQPTKKFKNVLAQLKDQEINYLLVSGLSTDWNFLNDSQADFSRETIVSEENFSAVYNENYSTFLTDPIDLKRWPPLQHTYGKLKIEHRFNTLLLQSIGGIQTKEPILGTFEVGNQKIGLWMGENSWRWRMYSYKESGDFKEFDGFISNLIQYLASKKQKNRLNVSHKELFYANEAVQFTASYLDDNLNFDPKAQLELRVYKSDGAFTRTVPFTAYTSTFKTALSDLPEGTYNYSVKVLNESISKNGSFKIAAYNLEEQFSSSNWKSLSLLAEETNGKLYFENDFEVLKSDLKSNSQFKTIQKAKEEQTPLIEWYVLLIAIVLALGLEWFTRKYFGKI